MEPQLEEFALDCGIPLFISSMEAVNILIRIFVHKGKKTYLTLYLKLNYMQKLIKKFHPLRWAVAVLVVSVFFIACNGDETKKEEAPAPVEVKKDSLPPIDNDSLIKDKPETIINKPAQ